MPDREIPASDPGGCQPAAPAAQMWAWGLEQAMHSHGPPGKSGLSLPAHTDVTTHSRGPVLGAVLQDFPGSSGHPHTSLMTQDTPTPH